MCQFMSKIGVPTVFMVCLIIWIPAVSVLIFQACTCACACMHVLSINMFCSQVTQIESPINPIWPLILMNMECCMHFLSINMFCSQVTQIEITIHPIWPLILKNMGC